MIVGFEGHTPVVSEGVFVATNASVIGQVTLASGSSVFFGAVLRGDILPISVGRNTNIQEHCLLHTSQGRTPTEIGEEVTVGHRAILHGCKVGNCSLIGMGATVLDGAVIGEESLIAAGALVPENKQIPPRSVVMGVPGKIVRTLVDEDIVNIRESAAHYVSLSRRYLSTTFAQG